LTSEKLAELKDVPGFAPLFLSDGKAPAQGAVLRQASLADTIDHLAHAGLDDFYRGDLERYRARLREPLELRLAAATLYNTPPPTQGLASLMILGLFERLGVTQA